jgi:glycosyltransferase involved in cell wall biosynthesis
MQKVSVVIPTLNSKVIGETIKSLYSLDYPEPFEVIVVGMDEPGIVQENDIVRFHRSEIPLPPAKARNIGAMLANGEIIIFLDSDCVVPKNWLSNILKPFSDLGIVAVGGGVKFLENNYWVIADNFSMFHSFLHTNPPRYVTQLPSLNLAVRNSAYKEVRGFDERYPRPSGEDFDLTLRLSLLGKLYFAPDAWVLHLPPRSSFKDLVRHSYIQGKYSTKVDWRYVKKDKFSYFPRSKLALYLLSPVLAAGDAFNLYIRSKKINYIFVLPAIIVSKWVWCIGAANSPWITPSNHE